MEKFYLQVSIKPEVPGRTLISVYHQYGEGSDPASSAPFSDSSSKDSVPPEPIPSSQMQQMMQQQQQQEQVDVKPSFESTVGFPCGFIIDPCCFCGDGEMKLSKFLGF